MLREGRACGSSRLLTITACTAERREPVAVGAPVRASTFDAAFMDTIDGAPATHLAVGGKLRVRIPDGVTYTNAFGPFAITSTSLDTLVITATGAGTGEIEIETATGYTRFAVSAAPIKSVGMVFDLSNPKHATVTLRDAHGNRLVDASLRIAPGSAPVSLFREAWDRVVFQSLPPGDVLVTTDLLGATRAVIENKPTRTALAPTTRRQAHQ